MEVSFPQNAILVSHKILWRDYEGLDGTIVGLVTIVKM